MYFGEKHGKSHADGLFGRLKAWMSYQIKSRKVVIKDAHDFFKHCREQYQTPKLDQCQHYHVKFEFVRPSDVRRHHDADLDQAVPKTQQLYSVCNTPEPLTLKVRSVPCLCLPCIQDKGVCLNASHTDPWKLIHLIPQKGANRRKYKKCKCPDADRMSNVQTKKANKVSDEQIMTAPLPDKCEVEVDVNSDDEIPEISIDFDVTEELKKCEAVKNTEQKSSSRNLPNRVTDHETDHEADHVQGEPLVQKSCSWKNISEEIIVEDFFNSEDKDQDIEIVESTEREPAEGKNSP